MISPIQSSPERTGVLSGEDWSTYAKGLEFLREENLEACKNIPFTHPPDAEARQDVVKGVNEWEHLFPVTGDYPKSSLTLAEMARPSASPASFLVAVPITLPMSLGPSAPTSAMMAFSAASSSSALICFGR